MIWVLYEFTINIKIKAWSLIVWNEINYKEDSNDLLIPDIKYQINPAEIESIEIKSGESFWVDILFQSSLFRLVRVRYEPYRKLNL